jgi:ribonuclease P protein component
MRPPARPGTAAEPQLSTGDVLVRTESVDNPPVGHWFGCLVPKRQARRAVTRSLVKRQMRSAFARQGACLASGLWLLRLKAPLTAAEFVSAASPRLRATLWAELDALLQRLAASQHAVGSAAAPAPRPRSAAAAP